MPERKFSEMPFGFGDEKVFGQAVSEYARDMRNELDNADVSWINSLDEHKREALLQVIKNRESELAILEAKLRDIPDLFAQIKGIYDEIVALELSGKSQDEILKFFADRKEAILAINGLLEHGLKINWGYYFIQIFLGEKNFHSL